MLVQLHGAIAILPEYSGCAADAGGAAVAALVCRGPSCATSYEVVAVFPVVVAGVFAVVAATSGKELRASFLRHLYELQLAQLQQTTEKAQQGPTRPSC